MMLEDVAARLLRGLDPEVAHGVALRALKLRTAKAAATDLPRLRTSLAGLAPANPIGLAAGFDKNAEVTTAMLAAGFGFVEVGTVTPRPQAGNPKPRVFRLTQDAAVINRLGFNNRGLAAFATNLAVCRAPGRIIGANIGANKESGDRAADYVRGIDAVWASASYVTVNISSPNTPGLRGLQDPGALQDLLARLTEARGPLTATHGARPLFVKVAPDLGAGEIEEIVEIAVAAGVDGLIVSNTTMARPETLRSISKRESGGLSGRPLFEPSTAILRRAAMQSKGRLALIGVGGVEDGRTALAKIKAGANAVQLYTAMVFRGLGVARAIAQELDAALAEEGFNSVSEAVGADL